MDPYLDLPLRNRTGNSYRFSVRMKQGQPSLIIIEKETVINRTCRNKTYATDGPISVQYK
jgi:hypothetical protein